MQSHARLPSAPVRKSAGKSVAYLTTALTFAGALAITRPAAAEEMQVSGPEIVTQVETHAVAAADGSGQVFGINKWVGALSLPGLFDSAQQTVAEGFRLDVKRGQGEGWGSLFWTNNDGTMTGSFKGNATFTMDDKGAAKGHAEGTFEMTGGTGRFASTRGHGTWNGNFDGPSYSGQMNLTVTGFEKRASAQ